MSERIDEENDCEGPELLGAIKRCAAAVNAWMGSGCQVGSVPSTQIALLREVALASCDAKAGLILYDPNIRWAQHTFEITYMQWDYSLTVRVEVGGNCKGWDVMRSALSTHADQLFQEQGECPTLVLKRPAADGSGDEDTLEVTADEDDIEDFLSEMCVGVRIVGHVKEAR